MEHGHGQLHELPASGGPTFLLTDVEGSTWLWERDAETMSAALRRHDALLANAVERRGGRVVKERGEGDSIFAVFGAPAGAVAAALDAQLAFDREPWTTEVPLRVRMAIHTGPAESRADDWYGPPVNRCGRLRSVAHGGQVLLSRTTAQLVTAVLPPGATLRSLGRHRLRDLPHPEELFQLCHERLRSEFPPVRSLDAAPHDLPVTRMPRVKITPPLSGDPQLVLRPALLDGALQRRLTTVVAGPGFGKSTALGAWASSAPSAWYTLDGTDASPTRLAAGIVEALNLALIDFAADFGAVPGTLESDPETVEGFAATLCTALDDALHDDLALVLDDFHSLPPEAPSVELVEALVRLAPGRLHLVLASRVDIPFPIERLRAQGQVGSVTAADLALSERELEGLLAGIVGEEGPALAADVRRTTAGWPAAARLAIEALRELPAPERSTALAGAGAPGGALYGYLAEEVLDRQPEQIRRLIERMAPIGSFTLELCEALGVDSPAASLAGLSRLGVFLEPGSGTDGWYALHGLIRDVALGHSRDPGELRDLQRTAAAWFEAHDHLDRALAAYVEAGEVQTVRALVAGAGHRLVGSGQAPRVLEILGGVADAGGDPAFDEAMGELLAAAGEHVAARRSLVRAAEGIDPMPAGLSFRYAMGVHYTAGRVVEALEIWNRSRPEPPQTHDDVMLLAFTANAEAQTGDPAAAARTAAAALTAARSLASRTPEAEAHIALGLAAEAAGDRQDAIRGFRDGLLCAEREENMIAVCRARVFTARALVDLGRLEEASTELALVLPLTERIGWWLFRAWGLCERARVAMSVGDLDQAGADCATAHGILRDRSSDFAARPLSLLGDLHALRGERAAAAAAYAEALELATRSGVTEDIARSAGGLARALAAEDVPRARSLVERAVAPATPAALVANGWVSLAAGDRDLAAERAEQALAAAARTEARLVAAEAAELAAVASPSGNPEALEAAAENWRALGAPIAEARARLAAARLAGVTGEPAARRAERRLRTFGVNTHGAQRLAGTLMAVPRAGDPPVAVETLGGFRVVRDGVAVGPEDWRKSRKARDLLKLLVARRGRPVTREYLMDVLWPDEPPERLGNRLSVALAAVRNVLDPARQFDADHFVRGAGASLSVDLAVLPVDVERFLSLAESGLALHRAGIEAEAGELLELAVEGYTGDFLEEDLYEDWAAPLRDETRSAYISVVRCLFERSEAAGDRDRAAHHLLRLLDRDPHDERAHLALVRLLVEAGRHGEARRRHLVYARRMREIGVEPAAFRAQPARERPPAAV